MMKSPSFQFYVQDFLLGTQYLSAEEVGAYVRLLCHQWDNGFIENNDRNLKIITGISAKKLENILKKFSLSKGNIYKNARLEAERKKQMDARKRRSDAGIKGNEIKYKEKNTSHCDRIAIADSKPMRSQMPRSSSSSSAAINSSKLSKPEVFEILRRLTDKRIPDETIDYESQALLKKYEGRRIGNIGALCNEWAANIDIPVTPKKSMEI